MKSPFQTGCLTSAPRGKGQAFCNPVARKAVSAVRCQDRFFSPTISNFTNPPSFQIRQTASVMIPIHGLIHLLRSPEPPSVRIIGLGNAGAQLADRLQMNGHADVVVMNTDAQSLLSSIVAKKVALGQKTTYGLGAGGDPEVGYDAAQESAERHSFRRGRGEYHFPMRRTWRRHSLRRHSNSCADCTGNRSSGFLNCHFAIQL